MRGLQGDLGTMPLEDLVLFLGNRKSSGRLQMERDGVKKEARILEGEVIHASSDLPREYLGQFLINMGLINEDQFLRAYETQKETKIFIGRILVMIGLVTDDQVLRALDLKFRETLLSAYAWTDGQFTFDPDAGMPELGGVEQRVPLLDIAREAEFRKTAWQAIRGAFPSGELKLDLDRSKLPSPPEPGSLDERLYTAIDEGQTLDEMALALHATDFFLYQRLYALHRLEAVKPRGAGPASPDPGLRLDSEPTPDEIADQARLLLEEGRLRDAHALARRAFDLSHSPAHRALKAKVEQAHVSELRKTFLGARCVPKLAVPKEALDRATLSAQARYLLSRVNGERTLQAIVSASPLAEAEALRLFDELLESRLLALA